MDIVCRLDFLPYQNTTIEKYLSFCKYIANIEKNTVSVTDKIHLLLKVMMSTAQGPIEAQNISVQIGDTKILNGVSFSLYPGEMCALIGPSGAGKSTLIKVLLGLREANTGNVLLGGQPVSNAVKVGYVPQDDALHRSLTIAQSLEFAAELWLYELSVDERLERIALITSQLGLADRMNVRIQSLSGGQRKRVSVAMELLHKPQFLVLDEPTSGLDPGLESKMMSIFTDVAQKGRILMVATHAMQSLDICDVLMILMKGHLLFFGTPNDAKEYFGVHRFSGIFEQLPLQKPNVWAQKWIKSSYRNQFSQRTPPEIFHQNPIKKKEGDTSGSTHLAQSSTEQNIVQRSDRDTRLAALQARKKK